MIADMNRLERAARLSMGDFQGPPTAAAPVRASRFQLRFVLLVCAVVVLGAGLFKLI